MSRAHGPMRARTWRRFLPRAPRADAPKRRRCRATMAAIRERDMWARHGDPRTWSPERVATRNADIAAALWGPVTVPDRLRLTREEG